MKTEGSLHLSKRRLADAVRAFADPVPFWDNGSCRYLPPLYTRLRGSLRGQPRGSGRRVPDSRLPCRSGILSLLLDIDGTVAGWDPHRGDTVARLHEIAERAHRPQDCQLLDSYATRVEAWTHSAIELLGEQPVEVPLREPCPACGKRYVYRMSNGEKIRADALRISENGARCLHCDTVWPQERFGLLAKLLGCDSVLT